MVAMFPFQNLATEAELTLDFLKAASQIARHVQQNLLKHTFTKEDQSPVTIGDYTIQALLSALLVERFPDDALVGEESSDTLVKEKGQVTLKQIAELLKPYFPHAQIPLICHWLDRGKAEATARYWTLDPIDGTKGFVRGDQYAVALSLIEDGKVMLGALACPNLNSLNPMSKGSQGMIAIAVAGGGAWSCSLQKPDTFDRLRVSTIADIREARMLRSYETMHTDTGRAKKLIEKLGIAAPALHLDSLAKHALLAAGAGDVMVRFPSSPRSAYTQQIWDYAPGVLMIQEAGGMITDLDGHPYDFSTGRILSKNRGLVASNKLLHEPVLEAVSLLK